MLHEHEGPEPRGGRGSGHLHGDLLVGGELEVHTGVLRELLEEVADLRRRSPRISGSESRPGLEEAPYDGLVAQEELLSSVRK